MLESLINPKRAEKGPWKMLFIGMLYAWVSLGLVKFFFSNDPILIQYSGMIVVTFCVMFSLPFMYFIIKQEEVEDEHVEGFFHVWKIHKNAIYAFMWLFLGFIIAFSFFNIVWQDSNLLNAQVETYCAINSPGNIDACVKSAGFPAGNPGVTGNLTSTGRFLSILQNNVSVMILTLIFSLFFGAGAIFVLAWNASVISAAIGIFTGYEKMAIPLGLARYMIHGFPEIAAYFITALAGGILGLSIVKNGLKNIKSLRVLENVAILLCIALVILVFAAAVEVYFTPIIFH